MVRAAYLAMELTTWFVIVPLAFASLLTGLVVSLGTQWGLFRHYWVLLKLALTVFATILLLLHTRPIGVLAGVARETMVSGADVGPLQMQLVGDAGAALLALLVNATLSVYKPRGMTPYGRRKQHEQRQMAQSIPAAPRDTPRKTADTPMADLPPYPDASGDTGVRPDRDSTAGTPVWVKVVGIIAIILVLLFVVSHLTGGGHRGHASTAAGSGQG